MIQPIADSIRYFLAQKISSSISSIDFVPVGGGSINQTFTVTVNKKEKYFAKINSADRFPSMFEKEKRGLELLQSRNVIRVPSVIGTFIENGFQVLVLEWIAEGARTRKFWISFGEQLAALHSVGSAQAGLDENNYMGALPQSNDRGPDWIRFFIDQRIEPQIRLALDHGLLQDKHHRQFEKLYQLLPAIFGENRMCLLHGDLWSGNFLCDESGMPVLIDPAVYYGHSSMDLGMTTLFGGFDPLFYQAYHEALPLPANHRDQWEICNLYPLLIHLNLFGKGYLPNIISVVDHFAG